MRLDNQDLPKSSFLSVEKDLEIITNCFLKNKRFKKLLYYTKDNALELSDLNEE